jgi:hypothetical protein
MVVKQSLLKIIYMDLLESLVSTDATLDENAHLIRE